MKMIKYEMLLFLALLLGWNAGNSQIIIDQETVSGVWGPDKTYIIKNDVRIPGGASLTIQKGVNIRLNPGVRITVNGTLSAVGTSTDTVKFIPDIPGTHWNNISFKNTVSPTLKYCLFEGTEKLAVRKRDDLEDLFGALNFGLDTDFDGISDCTFRNNISGAIFIGSNLAGDITIRNNHIQNGQHFGVTIHGGFYEKIIFENNFISGLPSTIIGFTGIKAVNINALSIQFQGNRISNARIKYDAKNSFWNHPGGAVIIESPDMANVSSVTFNNDVFYNSNGKKAAVFVSASKISMKGVSCRDNFGTIGGGCYLHGDEMDISGSAFSNNVNMTTSDGGQPVNSGGGGVVAEFIHPGSVLTVTGSEFHNNNLEGYPGGGLRIFGDNQEMASVSVSGCSFKDNNTNLYGGAVAISGFDAISQVYFGRNRFESNIAEGSKGGSGIWIDQVKSIGLLSVQESPSIKNHEAKEGNGGFLSANGISKISEFRYWKNTHSGYAKTGKNGGLIFLDVDEMDFLNFKENTGISGEANLSGGVLYSGSNTSIGKILFSQNYIVKSEALNGEGGAIYLNPANFVSLQFIGNSVDYTYAKSSGGLMFLNYDLGNDVTFSDNPLIKFAKSDANGGCFFLTGTNRLKNYFTFSGNTIRESSAKGNGGVLWFNGNMPLKELPFTILSNTVTGSSTAQGKGGFVYINGQIRQTVWFKGNIIQATSAVWDGGFAFLEPKALQAERLMFSNNRINESSKSLTESGGILSGEGSVKVLEVENNRINKLYSMKSGGGFFWKNSIQGEFPTFDVVVRLNRLTGSAESAKSSGGFMYVEADTISNLYIKDNYFEKVTALHSGGGFFLKTSGKGISDITLYKDTVANASALEQSGGFACFLSASGIDNLAIQDNLFKGGEFKSGADGGIIQVTANRYKKLSVDRNVLAGSLKAVNGGFLCLYGNIPVYPSSGRITFLNNKVSASASVTNGGFALISGNQDQSFIFTGNEFSGYMTAQNKGGILAIINGAGSCDSILISGNNFLPQSTSGLFMAKTGGILHYEGNFTNRVFQFSGNKVKQIRADSEGAVMYIRNHAPAGNQEFCLITDNEFDNLSTEINGAVISQNGHVKKRFVFRNNIMKNVFMTGAQSNGGALYLHIGDENKIKSIDIASNKVVTETSLGGGTFLKFTGSVVDTVSVLKNSFTDINSKLTGAFDINADSVYLFSSMRNQVREVNGQTGALYYLAGDSKAFLKNFIIREDTLKTIHAMGEGGAVFLNFPVCKLFSVEKSLLEKVTSSATGGFLAAHKGIIMDDMRFDQVEAKNSVAGVNGGFAGLSGTFGGIKITSNVHVNGYAAGNGGCFYLESLNAPSGMMQVVTSEFVGDKVKMSGNGGAFYLESLGVAEFTYNLFRDLKVKTNGGAVHARSFNRMSLDICTFTGNVARDNSGGALFLNTFYDLYTRNNVFRENLAQGGSGGAYYIRDGKVVMKRDSIVGNSAFTGGGGTFVLTGGTIDSVSIKQNYTTDPSNISSFGGGLFVDDNQQRQLLIQDCWFYKNNAYKGGGMYGISSSSRQMRSIYAYNLSTSNGGGVFLIGSPKSEFYNCIFHRNSVARHENEYPPTAGIHIFNTSPSKDSVRIVNSVFNRNNSFALGIEIPDNGKASDYKPAEIANSIIFYNGYLAEEIPQYRGEDGLFNFLYSDVEDLNLKLYGNSNINLLPNWLTPNYCLRTAPPFISPCIDRGNPLAIYNDTNGSRNDMGITGGPYAKYFCSDALIRDDNSPVDEEEILQSGFALYPNPTTGKVWLVPGSEIGQSFTVDVISSFGKIIRSEKRNAGFGSKIEIDLGNLPKGLYLIQVRNLSTRVVQKIILM